MNKWQVKAIIRSFLKKYHPPDLFPINLHKISAVVKSEVYYDSLLPQSVSGYLLPLKNKEFIIVINSNMPKAHQRFTHAHELSHIILQHQNISISPMLYSADDFFILGVTPYEREANIAATELLMPEKKVRELYQHGITSLAKLCDFFGVSSTAMQIRLEELGLVEKYDCRSFQKGAKNKKAGRILPAF